MGNSQARGTVETGGPFVYLSQMNPRNAYVICTTPRSGSTLLCSLLRDTRVAGCPDSHFHAPSLDKWLGYHGFQYKDFTTKPDALKAVFDATYKLGKGASDIFGLRMQRHSFDFFTEQLRVLYPLIDTDNSRINAAFGKTLFVHLKRKDKLGQAVSYVKAMQSGLWHVANDGTELERTSKQTEPVYDPVAIAAHIALSQKMDSDWEKWFAKEHITPLCLTYENLSAAPYATLGRVLAALGLEDVPSDDAVPPVAKMADATSQEWVERFQSETQL